MNVKFSPQAKSDLVYIHAHIAAQDVSAAERIISRLRQAIETLSNYPLLGRTGAIAGTREFAVHGLPYTVIYQIVSTADLDIVTIVHQRRLYPPLQD
ncbi:MAG: type II toxin-antitoxin system RelE/ParE family toxin [Rhizobium sp.]|nr:type II toxin-antitoxin system RelE/ParE family toxin [Rhizobium sp.]